MSSLGTMREITPLLPWRPAILSPGCSLRFTATKTLTIFMTPGGSSSPRCNFSTLLSKRNVRPATASSICFLRPSISAIFASSRIEICFHCAGGYSASTPSVISVPDFMPRGPPTAISPSINSLSLAAQQLLLRRHRRLALGGDLADEDVARLDLGTDIDDPGLVQILERLLADIRNVASDLFLAELGVARHHLELLDMDRGENVVTDDPLGDQDRILEVVAVPWHEGAQHITAERELAELGRRTVGDDVARHHRIPHFDERPLGDTGVLVRALEFEQIVNIDARGGGRGFRGCANDDAGGVDLVDNTRPAGDNRDTGVAGNGLLHPGANERRLGADQRHRLALHIRAHQGAVCVVVLEYCDQGGGHRDQLLWRDVDQVDVLGPLHDEISAFAAICQIRGDPAVRVGLDIGLGNRKAAFVH